MFNLIKNELQKIFSRVSTYVMLIVLALACIGYGALMKYADRWTDEYSEYNEDNLRYYEGSRDSYSEGTYYYLMEDRECLTIRTMLGQTETWKGSILDSKLSLLHMVEEKNISESGFASLEEFQRWESETEYPEKEATVIHLTRAYYEKLSKEREELISSIDQLTVKDYYEEKKAAYEKGSLQYQMYEDLIAHDVKPNSASKRLAFWGDYIDAMQQAEIAKNTDDKDGYEKMMSVAEVYKYALDHDLMEATFNGKALGGAEASYYEMYSKFWSAWCNSSMLLSFLGMMMIIIAGGCVAKEFSEGTIKFLLINPTKRSKIIWSKYLSLIAFTLIATVAVMLLNGLVSLVLFGTGEGGSAYVHLVNGTVVASSMFGVLLWHYAGVLVQAIVLTTMAFLISSLFRSSSLAIGIGIGAYAFGSGLTSLLASFGQDWGRYLIFANMNPWTIAQGEMMFAHQTVTGAVITIFVYMGLMLFMARDAFVRREV